ncbi:hypothetical protein [Longispora fulva]|uniref:Uncharacterized protein n=1 Tax=Longispora fulva TaxID=619741 RepID=A0A8J7KFF2_9ACTN|nr:hypothetical protein [Longispora fulva]MBG6136110.1 hypothetical protein [Longispora fulva]
MAAAPGGRDADRVRQLADDPAGRWSVVVVGRLEETGGASPSTPPGSWTPGC